MKLNIAELTSYSADRGRHAIRVMEKLKELVHTDPKLVEEYLRGAWLNHMEDYIQIAMGKDAGVKPAALTAFVVLNAYFMHAGHWAKMIASTEEHIKGIENRR